VAVAPPPPKGFQVLTAPVEIPDVIHEVDLSKKVTDEADFSGKGVVGGTSKGVAGGTGVRGIGHSRRHRDPAGIPR
jgi:protein TonB